MKFYLAFDKDGRKQLRHTKADIEKVNKTYQQIDIPVDQASIMELVQDSFDTIHELHLQISGSAPAEGPASLAEQVPDTASESPASRQANSDTLDRPYIRGPKTKNPPRYRTADQAAVDAGVEFVPIDRIAETNRLLDRCPLCSMSEETARRTVNSREAWSVEQWAEATTNPEHIRLVHGALIERAKELAISLEPEPENT